jgi:hypothetical protein
MKLSLQEAPRRLEQVENDEIQLLVLRESHRRLRAELASRSKASRIYESIPMPLQKSEAQRSGTTLKIED